MRRLLKWIRLTGGVPTHSGADALAHILFIKHQRPEIYARCFKLLEPMDYLNFRLTGRAVATYATIYPYLLTDNRDNTHVKYDDGLIAWCGLDRAKLPELAPVGSILGTILPVMAEEWGLSANTQVIAGTPDSQAAALGSGAVRDFAGHVCIGSSDWLSCHVPFKKTNLTNYIATMPSAIHGRNMVMAEQGAAGKCLGIFVDQWLFPKDDLTPAGPPADVYRQLFSLAAAVPAGSEGLLFLPWLNGAGPPSGESAIRGGFLNQSLHTGRAQAVRAIMEGVAFNVRWVQASVERFVGRRFAALNFIGGCARSDLWCQILADVLGVEIRRVANPDMAISRGAAIAALVALKRTTPEEMGDSTPIQDVFSPNPSHRATYAELFGEFVNCYKANRGIFGRLNGK